MEKDFLTPYAKINWKWIKDSNIRPKTLKFLEGNIEENLLNIGLGNDFLTLTHKSTDNKTKYRQVDSIKLI